MKNFNLCQETKFSPQQMVVTNMCPFPKFYGYIVVHFENILILRNCTLRNLAVRRHQVLSFFSPVQEKKKKRVFVLFLTYVKLIRKIIFCVALWKRHQCHSEEEGLDSGNISCDYHMIF